MDKNEFSIRESKELNPPEESGNLGESETKIEKNGMYHGELVNGNLLEEINVRGTAVVSPSVTVVSLEEGESSSSSSVNKRRGLKKWRRIPREPAKKTGRVFNTSGNCDLTVSSPVRQMMLDAYGNPRDQPVTSNSNGGNSVFPDDLQRNGRIGPGKKARGFKIDKESSNSTMVTMGSDSRSSNCVFLQDSNDVAGEGRQSETFENHNEEYSDGKDLLKDVQNAFVKSDDESDGKIEKHEGSTDGDLLVESIKGLHFAHEEFEKEVLKWRDVGKDDLLILNDPMYEILELKNSKILELEFALNSGGIKTAVEDLIMKVIQADVEYVVISTTTKRLAEGPLLETKRYLQQKNTSHEDAHVKTTKQDGKLKTKEDLKKLQSRVGRFTSCFMIQFILILVTLYLKFSPQNVEVVPT